MKHILFIILFLAIVALARSQTVTTAQWWFDGDYGSAVTEPASGRDFVWRKNISTAALQPGFHWLNVHFKSSDGHWGSAMQHWFLKLDGVHGNVISHFEYWFGMDFDNRKSIPLSTVNLSATNVSGIILNLPMRDVPNGLYQLNYRVGYVGGVYSTVYTTLFYKCDNVISEGNSVFEYWIDDHFEARRQQTFANPGGTNTLSLDLSGLSEGGLHRLNYRIGNQGGVFGSVSTDWFFNNSHGASVLEWTFDDNPTVHTRTLASTSENVVFDLSAGSLSNGVHSVHFRAGRQNGTYTTPLTAWFVKGANPYAPAPSEEQKIAGYIYWFDNQSQTTLTDALITPPAPYYAMDEDLPVGSLTRGKHTINMRFLDNYGQPGEIVTDTFKVLQGHITQAKIKNLEPNINPFFPLDVKEYATIYRYYKIVDENNVPIPNAKIEYKVGNYIGFSSKSGDDGVVTIEFNVWGENVDDESDDIITRGTQTRMAFVKLFIDNQEVNTPVNDFAGSNNYIFVQQYRSDESTLGLGIGLGGGVSLPHNMKLSAGADTKISFTNKYDGLNLTGRTYTLEGSIKASGSGSIPFSEKIIENKILYKTLGGFPSIKPKGSLKIEGTGKFKQEMEIASDAGWQTYLAIFYDLVYWTYVNTGFTNENLDVILNTLGNYLADADYQQNKESKWGANLTLTGGISSFAMNYAPVEIIELPNGFIQPPLWYNKKDINVDINFSGKAGFDTGGGYKSQRSKTNYTQYNFLSFAIEGSAEISAIRETGFNIPNSPNEQYGVSISGTKSSSVKFSREHPDNSPDIEKASLTLGSGTDVELEVNYGFYSGSVKPSKDYSYKYTIDKPVFDYLHSHSDLISTLPLSARNTWRYLDNQDNVGSNISLPFTHVFSDYEDDLTALFKKIDYQNTPNLNKSVSLTGIKQYAGSLDIKKRIGTPKWLDWFGNFEVYIHGNLSLEGQYPLSEAYWHFGQDTILPIIKYRETSPFSSLGNFGKEASYYFAPFDRTDEKITSLGTVKDEAITNLDAVIDKIKSLLAQKWDDAKEKARDVLNGWYNTYEYQTEKGLEKLLIWLGPWSYGGAPQQNMNRSASMPGLRRYSPMLSSYKQFTENPQTDISTVLFEIPCENDDVFDESTDINFSHYYPGGEVLGATIAQDTFVVISEIAFLSAVHKWDTLTVAPNGNFKIFATAGADDLAFLEINASYPVGVYHKAFVDSLWHFIGNTNDTIYFNELGKFCLGVGVSNDHTPPVITISKEEGASEVSISITDNMAVYWRNVHILVNGLEAEYERDGGNVAIPLTEKQLAEDIHVTVYASDLARNEAQKMEVFAGPTGIIPPTASEKVVKLYPNPAKDVCTLQISDVSQLKSMKYAVVSPLGNVIAQGNITDTETAINVGNFESGVYFVVVHDKQKIFGSYKLLKQ
ncbi:MAG: T9SS type A sorting domain-containing protein [Dysgonamonadaceae bacterium]|jgi:hypothetical protein|nr:T9SS type A sorting domain-containing protein [Dysgonamonadaceae bacterium]